MKKLLVAFTAFAVLFGAASLVSPAFATEAKDCSKIADAKEKKACEDAAKAEKK